MSALFIEAAFKTSFLLAAAAATNTLLSRRASAASRHLVWTLAVVGLLLLPVLSAALPSNGGSGVPRCSPWRACSSRGVCSM